MELTKVIGENKEGYTKILAEISPRQVHSTDVKVNNTVTPFGHKLGHTISIDPKDFPEMDRFYVTVEYENAKNI